MTLQCNILYNDAAESRSVVHRILELNHNPIRLNLVNLAQPYWTFYHEVSDLWPRYSSHWEQSNTLSIFSVWQPSAIVLLISVEN